MTVIAPERRPVHSHEPDRKRKRKVGAATRMWQASPLTYFALIVACVLSVFPIYWTFIVATRTNDSIHDVPPPLLPGEALGGNMERLFANEDAAFLIGLGNSVIVFRSSRIGSAATRQVAMVRTASRLALPHRPHDEVV